MNAFIFIFFTIVCVICTSKGFSFKDPSTKLLKSINFYILYFNNIATNIDKGFCFFIFF